LGDGFFLALGDEDGVVAEAFAAARFVIDPTGKRARAAEFVPVRRDADELAHVTRAAPASVHALELAEQPAHRIVATGAGRLHARASVQGRDLDPGVLAEH